MWGYGRDWNWEGDALLKLLPHMAAFAGIARIGFEIDSRSTGLGDRAHGLGGFALAHEGHTIEVWNERGQQWPQRRTVRIVGRRFEVIESQLLSQLLPRPLDVLSCGHEALVDTHHVFYIDSARECPYCVEDSSRPRAPERPPERAAQCPYCMLNSLDEGHAGPCLGHRTAAIEGIDRYAATPAAADDTPSR